MHCHLRWDFVWQRPQQIFSRLARSHRVLFIDAPGAYYIEVLGKKDIQGDRPSFSGVYDVTSNRTLPAGDYHVLVTYEGDKAPKEADAKVTAGERTEIKVE